MTLRPGDVDLADPVHWNEISDAGRSEEPPMSEGFWVLTKHADIVRAPKDHETFSSHLGGPVLWDLDEEMLARQRAGIMGMDTPGQARYRKLVSGPFAPRNVTSLEGVIRERTTEIVDAVAAKGHCDFVMDLSWDL